MTKPLIPKRREKNNRRDNWKKYVTIKPLPSFRFREIPLRIAVILIGFCAGFITTFTTNHWKTGFIMFIIFGVLTQVLLYGICAFPLGTTLMAVRKGKCSWSIEIRHIAFWRLARHHRKSISLLRQFEKDLNELRIPFASNAKVEAITWLIRKPTITRLVKAGFEIRPAEVDRLKLFDLWIIWYGAQLFMKHRKLNPCKAKAPFNDK